MHFNWNKRVLASSFAIFSMATSLYAIPNGSCDQKMEPVCCENPKPGPFAFSYPTDLGLSCPRDFYIHLDGLAMQAKQEGMDFAITDTGTPGSPTAPITLGEVKGFSSSTNSWDYNPGMRLGFGCFLDHDAWAIDFNWTWLNITNYKKAGAGTGVLIPGCGLGDGNGTTGSGPNANGKWVAKYNVLDLAIEKPYHVSRYMVVSPHFGLRGGSIDQVFSVKYGGNPAQNGADQMHQHAENDWRGVGLRFGMKTDWIVGKGWNLFANVSGSMIASKFEVDQRLSVPNNDGFNIDNNFYQNVTNLEMAVGLAWSKYFDRNKYRIGLRAAYEFVQWFDQLRTKKFFSGNPGYANDTVSHGDLSLNGFSLRLQLDI